jgi:hypothetical protein
MRKLSYVMLILLICSSLSMGYVTTPVSKNLFIAYDGSGITAQSGKASDWLDQALADHWVGEDLEHDANNTNASTQPAIAMESFGSGSHYVLDFDGVNDKLETAAFNTPINQPITAFVVAKVRPKSDEETYGTIGLVGNTTSSSEQFSFGTISSGRHLMNAGTGVIAGGSFLPAINEWAIYAVNMSSQSGGTSFGYRITADYLPLGSTDDLGNSAIRFSGNTGTNPLNQLRIGQLWGGQGSTLNGQIAEMLIYAKPTDGTSSVSIDSADTVEVINYLYEKYLKPAPQSGPVEPNSTTIDDFESYSSYSDMVAAGWDDSYGGTLLDVTSSPAIDTTAMQFEYDDVTSSYGYYSPATMEFAEAGNWSQQALLGFSIMGDSGNTVSDFYVEITDGTETHKYDLSSQSEIFTADDWIEIAVDLSEAEDAGVNLASVTSFTIGTGNGSTPGGSGTLYVDDIYVSTYVAGDLTGDGKVNLEDFAIFSANWLYGVE